MDPNYPMKTLNPNSEKVGVGWSEGLSYTVLLGYSILSASFENFLPSKTLENTTL